MLILGDSMSVSKVGTQEEVVQTALAVKPDSIGIFDKIRAVFKRCCLGLFNDTLAMAGSLNAATAGSLDVGASIEAKTGTSYTPVPTDANTGAFSIGGGANGLIFAVQNIFKGIFFAKEGANTGDSTRLGIGSARVVRGTLDMVRNASTITKGGILLSSQAQSLQGVLSKVAIGAAAGAAVSGLIVCATGVAMAHEVITEAKAFEKIAEKPDQVEHAFDHLASKLKVQQQDINNLKKEITGTSSGAWSSLSRYAKEGFRRWFGDPRTEFVMLCRQVMRGKDLDAKTQEKLEALKAQIEKLEKDPSSFATPEFQLEGVGEDKLEGFKDLYLKIETEQLQEKKSKLFNRVFGQEVRALIESPDCDKAIAVAKAKDHVTSSKRLFIALGVLAALGTIVNLAFSIVDYLETFTGMPIMKIVETSVLLVSTLLMLGLDLAFFLKSTEATTDRASKIGAVGTLILSWATQTALLISFKLSMIAARVAIPVSLVAAGMMVLIRKAYLTKADKKPEESIKDSSVEQSVEAPKKALVRQTG